MTFDPLLTVYLLPVAALWLLLYRRRLVTERKTLAAKATALASGLAEPASLHPVIDPALCMGCGACVSACPEGDVLGLIRGKAELIEPTQCIGHGACKTACPFDAISLVFGTQTRGIDIPSVGPDFQTNVPGIFIAGELGGMGLIRNAIEQGRQAIDTIASRAARRAAGGADLLDVVIVGAGPAGLAATLGAKAKGLRSVTVEQDSLGGTVAHFPRGKLVMTKPAELPLVGKVRFKETTKEALLGFWEDVVKRTGIRVNFQERVDAVRPLNGGGFEVATSSGQYQTRHVLLAIGRRGTPRRLDVPGEDLPKVVYRLIDAEQYAGQNVLVVGGGDSAIEAAVSIAGQPGAKVALSYRSEAFSRVKPKNREAIDAMVQKRRIRLLLSSAVESIQPGSVVIRQGDNKLKLPNDAVIVCAGGILPTGFLKSIGVEVETKHGTA